MNKKEKANHAHDMKAIRHCYHESGHVIAGLINFYFVTMVKIGAPDLQECSFIETISPDFKCMKKGKNKTDLIKSYLKLKAAGAVAESIMYNDLSGTDAHPDTKSDARHDSQIISQTIIKYKLTKGDKNKYKEELNKIVKKDLILYWKELKATAHMLFNDRYAEYADIKRCILKNTAFVHYWEKQFKCIELLIGLNHD